MTKSICFFHRNYFNRELYVKIGNHLKNISINVLHVNKLGKIDDEEVFECEDYIERNIDKIDISYESLNNLEINYPNCEIMRALFSERDFNYFPKYYNLKAVPYEVQLKYLVGTFKALEHVVSVNDIDCVVSDLPSGIPDVFQSICKSKGIKYISIRSSKVMNGIVLCDDFHDTPSGLIERFNEYLGSGIPDVYKQKSQLHFDSIREKIEMPGYMVETGKRFNLLTIKRLLKLFSHLKKNKVFVNTVSMDKHPLINSIRWNLHRTFNIWLTKIYRSKWFYVGDMKDKIYLVFTLQYEPENSTSVRAYPFYNQMCVIEQISKALPLGVYLMVKEHKGNQGYRKGKFYNELHYLPNVKLIRAEAPVNDLLKYSVGLITLTSRMGWESLIMKKPVIAIGKTFYTQFEYVKKPQSWNELKSMIKECVKSKNIENFPDYDKKLLAYASAYISLTHKGIYIPKSPGVFDEENIRDVSLAILRDTGVNI